MQEIVVHRFRATHPMMNVMHMPHEKRRVKQPVHPEVIDQQNGQDLSQSRQPAKDSPPPPPPGVFLNQPIVSENNVNDVQDDIERYDNRDLLEPVRRRERIPGGECGGGIAGTARNLPPMYSRT